MFYINAVVSCLDFIKCSFLVQKKHQIKVRSADQRLKYKYMLRGTQDQQLGLPLSVKRIQQKISYRMSRDERIGNSDI